jgi:hypothetical protein
MPADETAVFQDEVDVHLNPKIGACWMRRGQQASVVTPGNNVKRYFGWIAALAHRDAVGVFARHAPQHTTVPGSLGLLATVVAGIPHDPCNL